MSKPRKCQQCEGTGTVKITSPDKGYVTVMCGECKGTGFVIIKENEETGEQLLLD